MIFEINNHGLQKRDYVKKITSLYSQNQQVNIELLEPRVIRLSVLWCLGRYTPKIFRKHRCSSQ